MSDIFTIYPDTKVFVGCIPGYKTGGTELVHQLVSLLNHNGVEAYVYYYTGDKKNAENLAFLEYNCPYVMSIEKCDNNSHNILIAPEIYTRIIYRYKNMQKAIWWLSVDFYFKFLTGGHTRFIRNIKDTIKEICGFPDFKFGKDKNDVVQLCQSNYAIDFVKKRGCTRIAYLSDYINTIYLNEPDAKIVKQNIILYNPKKGLEKAKNIMTQYQGKYNEEWIALQGLSNKQVYELLQKSKVYIDFGEHPGKDRFPREACACGCCVITGKKGAAKYYEDVPINEDYKFYDDGDVSAIIEKIHDCCINYTENIKNFDYYKSVIMNEKKMFEEQVNDIFSTKRNNQKL